MPLEYVGVPIPSRLQFYRPAGGLSNSKFTLEPNHRRPLPGSQLEMKRNENLLIAAILVINLTVAYLLIDLGELNSLVYGPEPDSSGTSELAANPTGDQAVPTTLLGGTPALSGNHLIEDTLDKEDLATSKDSAP